MLTLQPEANTRNGAFLTSCIILKMLIMHVFELSTVWQSLCEALWVH